MSRDGGDASEPDREHAAEPTPASPGSPAESAPEGGRLLVWVRRNRARLEILAIGAIALGGIVCMCLATLLIVWRLSTE